MTWLYWWCMMMIWPGRKAVIGEGGRNLVALEAVKKLTVNDVTFPSVGYDWFNPYEMALRLGASAETATVSRADHAEKK